MNTFTENQSIFGPYYEWIVAFVGALGGLTFGYEIGVTGQVLEMDSFKLHFQTAHRNETTNLIQDDIQTKTDFDGNVTGILLIGCAIGCIILLKSADSIGRKWSLVLGSFFYSVGGAFQGIGLNYPMFFAGRFIAGVGVGILASCVSLFISEIAPKERRGAFLALEQVMIAFGIFLASAMNSILFKSIQGDWMWKWALGIQGFIGFILFTLVICLPESPRWLISKDRLSEAEHVLTRVRNKPLSSPELRNELNEIVEMIQSEKKMGAGSLAELVSPPIRSRFIIASILQICQQFTGVNAIFYYQSSLVSSMGFDPATALGTITMVNNLFNLFATIPGLYWIDRVGRRALLISGGIGMGIAYLLFGGFIALCSKAAVYGWLALISMYIFFFSFDSSWGPVPWAYVAEIFPYRVRGQAVSSTTILNWAANALVAKLTPILREKLDYLIFIIFGVLCLLMAVFVYFFVPETKGLSLEHIDDAFSSAGNGTSAGDFRDTENVTFEHSVTTDLKTEETSVKPKK